MKVKMYRHTLKCTEHLPKGMGGPLFFYRQGDWTSTKGLIPPRDKELVLIEEKEIEVADSCIRRRKKSDWIDISPNKHNFEVGDTVKFTDQHPWRGQLGKIISFEKIGQRYERPKVELLTVPNQEVFIMADGDAVIIDKGKK